MLEAVFFGAARRIRSQQHRNPPLQRSALRHHYRCGSVFGPSTSRRKRNLSAAADAYGPLRCPILLLCRRTVAVGIVG